MLKFCMILGLLWVCIIQPVQLRSRQSKNPSVQEESSQYIIDKLQRHLDLLNQFNKKNKKEHLVDWNNTVSVSFFTDCDMNCVTYKHNLVALCLKQMKVSGTLDPFFETWIIFLRNYPHVETDLFLKEMSILLFCLYKNILLSVDTKLNNRVTAPEIMALYSKVSLLPINEVLFALDHCYIRLIIILKEYEFYSSMSWVQWLEKYWWVPPVVTIGILYKVFFIHLLWRHPHK